MQNEKKPGEFKTSLVGFKKADVLAYIDQLSQQTLAEQKEQKERTENLQSELELLQQDKDKLVEKTREVCEKLTSEEKRANEEESRARFLTEQLAQSEENARDCRIKLFNKDQEAVVLRADIERLNKLLEQAQNENKQMLSKLRAAEEAGRQQSAQCDELKAQCAQEKQNTQAMREDLEGKMQQHQEDYNSALQAEKQNAAELESQRQAAQQACDDLQKQLKEQSERCTQVMEQQREELRQELLLGRAKLRQQSEKDKKQVQQSAQEIARTVTALRGQLNEVDAQIEETGRQLQKATSAIYQALDKTEQGLERLGADVQSFPKTASRVAESPKSVQKPKEKANVSHPVNKPVSRRKTVSEGLLDLLEHLVK